MTDPFLALEGVVILVGLILVIPMALLTRQIKAMH